MGTIQNKYVVKDGRVYTAHLNRHGKLVDFRAALGPQANANGRRVEATFFPASGVQCAPLRIPVAFDIVERAQETCVWGFCSATITLRMQYAVNLTCEVDGQTISLSGEVCLGMMPEDEPKYMAEEKRLRDVQAAEEAAAREIEERAQAALPQRVAAVMKTADRKVLLRWANGKNAYEDARFLILLGVKTVPKGTKEFVLRLDAEARQARREAWLAAHPAPAQPSSVATTDICVRCGAQKAAFGDCPQCGANG